MHTRAHAHRHTRVPPSLRAHTWSTPRGRIWHFRCHTSGPASRSAPYLCSQRGSAAAPAHPARRRRRRSPRRGRRGTPRGGAAARRRRQRSASHSGGCTVSVCRAARVSAGPHPREAASASPPSRTRLRGQEGTCAAAGPMAARRWPGTVGENALEGSRARSTASATPPAARHRGEPATSMPSTALFLLVSEQGPCPRPLDTGVTNTSHSSGERSRGEHAPGCRWLTACAAAAAADAGHGHLTS